MCCSDHKPQHHALPTNMARCCWHLSTELSTSEQRPFLFSARAAETHLLTRLCLYIQSKEFVQWAEQPGVCPSSSSLLSPHLCHRLTLSSLPVPSSSSSVSLHPAVPGSHRYYVFTSANSPLLLLHPPSLSPLSYHRNRWG